MKKLDTSRFGITYNHAIDEHAYFYNNDNKFLYWRTAITGDILRAPSGDNNLP